MQTNINWGIIGLGNIADLFAKDLALVETTKLIAVASRNQTKADQFAQKHQAAKAYGNYEAILNDPKVDIIYIATPHDSHQSLTIAALKAGKHVLCEKPLAVNQAQVQKMIKVAQQEGKFLMEAFWSKFNPSVKAALKLVEEGRIGAINYLNADFTLCCDFTDDSRWYNMELAGGSLLDMGVYPVFLAYNIFGVPEQILATARFHSTGADIQTSAILKYKNGIANILSGFASESDMVAKIYGTEGRIYLQPYWHEAQGYTLIEGNWNQGKTIHQPLPTKGKGFTYEIEECLACIRQGKIQSPNWTHQNSLELISIVDEIRRQTGLKYPFE